jgi:ligand-binding SRPBCC domain-containing protein
MAMKTYILEHEQVIERSRAETFAFFSDAFNLERITPRFLGFRILTAPPIHMAAGTLIEYRLSLLGIGFRWKTLIEAWTPETSFIDTQLDGPYALWQHTHSFEAIDVSRTRVCDRVLYRLPFGIFGRIAHALFVRRTLEKIFNYRADVIARLLAPNSRGDANANDLPVKNTAESHRRRRAS